MKVGRLKDIINEIDDDVDVYISGIMGGYIFELTQAEITTRYGKDKKKINYLILQSDRVHVVDLKDLKGVVER